jgi:hypothetical protein
LFTQNTIASSVCFEQNSYKITAETARYVNSNGDTWSNESLLANYKSFCGAYNYVNHVQEPDKSVGFIADATLRRIPVENTNTFIYYCDILIATSKDFPELVDKILLGDIEYLSMGCEVETSFCSMCGKKFVDEADSCEHVHEQYGRKGKYYVDNRGVRRRIAEVLGTKEAGSCRFIEASWLTEVPAFGGAVMRSKMPLPANSTVYVDMPRFAFEKDAVQRFIK